MQTLRYAVTVRKKNGVFLLIKLVRTPDNQIFVPYPAPLDAPGWQPHTSIHKDGHVHEKDFGRESMGRNVCKPDASFRGTETITHLAMRPEQWADARVA